MSSQAERTRREHQLRAPCRSIAEPWGFAVREFILLSICVVGGLCAGAGLVLLTAMLVVVAVCLAAAVALDGMLRGERLDHAQAGAPQPWWAEDAECFLTAEERRRAMSGDRD